jgi:glycine/D-amino acid oxidase-like deaminating enzyme
MINPLVFRRMTKSWRVDSFLPYLKAFYQSLEKDSETSFFHKIPIRRLFSSEQELNFWKQKQNLEEFKAYMTQLDDDSLQYTGAPNSYGSGIVKESYWVDPKCFMQAAYAQLNKHGRITFAMFDHQALDPVHGTYLDRPYSKIVFCEGAGIRSNPYFHHLPIQTTKGETITIHSDHLPESESLNRKCFVLPLGSKRFKIGATYVWNTANTEITEAGRMELEEKLNYTTMHPYTILQQEAGVRPTTPDRRPFIGQHTELEKLYVFNGLGTKGYMLAPLLAKEFTDFLVRGLPLSEEVNIDRF